MPDSREEEDMLLEALERASRAFARIRDRLEGGPTLRAVQAHERRAQLHVVSEKEGDG